MSPSFSAIIATCAPRIKKLQLLKSDLFLLSSHGIVFYLTVSFSVCILLPYRRSVYSAKTHRKVAENCLICVVSWYVEHATMRDANAKWYLLPYTSYRVLRDQNSKFSLRSQYLSVYDISTKKVYSLLEYVKRSPKSIICVHFARSSDKIRQNVDGFFFTTFSG